MNKLIGNSTKEIKMAAVKETYINNIEYDESYDLLSLEFEQEKTQREENDERRHGGNAQKNYREKYSAENIG